jgi:hypothetical protein
MRADVERHDQALAKLEGLPDKMDQIFNLLSPPEERFNESDVNSEISEPDAGAAIDDLLKKVKGKCILTSNYNKCNNINFG